MSTPATRVLITGSSGFVGGALGVWLRGRQGVHVVGLSRSPPRAESCDEHVRHDLARPLTTDLGAFDAIVHCAALASPWAAPGEYRAANIDGLRNIIDAARRAPPRRFVFVSSTAVHYAFADQLGLAEDTPWPKRAINGYAATKRQGEAMVRASGLRWTIVRPRAVFGPGDTVVFPRILRAAAEGMLPKLRRNDGVRPLADLLYIDNLCWFIEQILEKDLDGVFNLANGEPVEIPTLLHEVLSRLGLPLPRREVSVRSAMAAAGALEIVSRTVGGWREPAVTRFGVSSLAYSRTVDPARTWRLIGQPPVRLAEGLDAFLRWQAARRS